MARPKANGGNGRNGAGRFTVGNPGGPGNPYTRRVAELRSALLDAVTLADVRALGRALVKHGKAGDVAAARLVLAYTVGRPPDEADPGGAIGLVEAVRARERAARNGNADG